MFIKHHPWNVHVSGVFSWTIVFRFKPTNKKSALIELTGFKSFDSKVSSFYRHLLINFSCKSTRKPLNAQYCTRERTHRGRHYDCACYTVFTRFWCTSTQHVSTPTEAEQQLCSEALTSEVGLLQTFRVYKKWIPLSNIWAINSRL